MTKKELENELQRQGWENCIYNKAIELLIKEMYQISGCDTINKYKLMWLGRATDELCLNEEQLNIMKEWGV